jgi:hypothetical protein
MRHIVLLAVTALATACAGPSPASTTPAPSIQPSATSAATPTPTSSTTTSPAAKGDMGDLRGKTVAEAVRIAKTAGYRRDDIRFDNDTVVENATAIQDYIVVQTAVADGRLVITPMSPDLYSEANTPPSVLTYTVSGAGSASITYSTASGMAQITSAALPWSTETTDDVDVMVVTAQHKSASGPITCVISRDGVEIAKVISQGAYAVVTCRA